MEDVLSFLATELKDTARVSWSQVDAHADETLAGRGVAVPAVEMIGPRFHPVDAAIEPGNRTASRDSLDQPQERHVVRQKVERADDERVLEAQLAGDFPVVARNPRPVLQARDQQRGQLRLQEAGQSNALPHLKLP